MHRRLYARCDLTIKITARSPLLVQGAQTEENAESDKKKTIFFKARDPGDGREKYCIPATTLKGVWRNTAERILRTFAPTLACDPFEEDKDKKHHASKSCSKRLEDDPPPSEAAAYVAVCPVCRLFGSTAHAGLLQVQDIWGPAVDDLQPEPNTGIAIDRFTGGAKTGALYELKTLPPKTQLESKLRIENVEFWHLGLLALVCRELNDGRAQIGSGTRRGLGLVQVDWESAEFRYPAARYAAAAQGQAGALASAQALAAVSDRVAYPQAEPWLLPELRPRSSSGWSDGPWVVFQLAEKTLQRLQQECIELALAPKLREKHAGFAYARPSGKEADHAGLSEPL